MLKIDLYPYYEQGLVPLPVNAEKKSPAGGFSQAEWYKTKPGWQEIKEVWQKHGSQATGAALICGWGYEVIDIDTKNDPGRSIGMKYLNLIESERPDLYERLVICGTPSGGAHIWYKYDDGCEVRGSKAIALVEYSDIDREFMGLSPNAKTGVIIETRGSGGYALIHPSPGYLMLQGNVLNMPVLNADDREYLWDVALSFNRYVKPVEQFTRTPSGSSDKPGDDYNEKADVLSLLQQHGWTYLQDRGNIVYLNRPDAPHKRTSGIYLKDKDLFVNYSTSVSDFNTGSGYSPWRVYAILEHGGDFSAAARALSDQGFGGQRKHVDYTTMPPENAPEGIEDLKQYETTLENKPSYTFDFHVVEPPDRSTPYGETKEYGVGFPGAIIGLLGKPKSRKTIASTAIIAAALTGGVVGRFKFDEPKSVLRIDTEQPDFYAWKTYWRVAVQAYGQIDRFWQYLLEDITPKQRREAITRLVAYYKPDILVIDGISDLLDSINKEDDVYQFVDQWLKPMRKNGMTIIFIHHINKGDNNSSGWIGTIMSKKCDASIDVVRVEGGYASRFVMREARAEPFDAFELITDPGMHGLLYDPDGVKPNYDYTIADEIVEQVTGQPFSRPTEDEEYIPKTNDEDLPF